MEIRHLDALLAITEAGSFSAAAEVLHTVQSNVSEQIRQLERELGVPVLVRGRRGATPTEFGRVVLERARRIRGELEAMRVDLSLLQGLEAGHASLGVVGTASRWLVPALVGDLRQRAPGVMLRINEGASERLAAEVVSHELTMAVVTEPIVDPRLPATPTSRWPTGRCATPFAASSPSTRGTREAETSPRFGGFRPGSGETSSLVRRGERPVRVEARGAEKADFAFLCLSGGST